MALDGTLQSFLPQGHMSSGPALLPLSSNSNALKILLMRYPKSEGTPQPNTQAIYTPRWKAHLVEFSRIPSYSFPFPDAFLFSRPSSLLAENVRAARLPR